MSVRVIGMYQEFHGNAKTGDVVIDTTSRSKTFGRDLSPMIVGPVSLYDGHVAANVENAWQHAKLYPEHADVVRGQYRPNAEYWRWARDGWANPRAVRYPFGKARVPLGAWWNGRLLNYVDSRRFIYCPLYAEVVRHTWAFAKLRSIVESTSGTVWLRDFDGYDHVDLGMSLVDVLYNERRKMGHAFVLAGLLKGWPYPWTQLTPAFFRAREVFQRNMATRR